MASLYSIVLRTLGLGPREPLALATGDEKKIDQRAQRPRTQTRWYPADVEAAEYQADSGDLSTAARLMRSAHSDGTYLGVMSTRTGGLVRLPRRVAGNSEVVQALTPTDDVSTFDDAFPSSELALLARDGIELGVGIAEFVWVADRDYPVLVRRDPEFLRYKWESNEWTYQSRNGTETVTPGDGRWVLHTPGGRTAPWQQGVWKAVAKAYVRKELAAEGRDLWESGLANPARIAKAPNGASEAARSEWLDAVGDWGRNTVYTVSPGYDVTLLESNGRGADSFRKTIAEQNAELITVVAGQTVTTDGGVGFANASIFQSIRTDLIQSTADDLAHTLNTQCLPVFVASRWGAEAVATHRVSVGWDTTPPMDKAAEAKAASELGSSIATLTQALAPHGLAPDVAAICAAHGLPTTQLRPLAAPLLSESTGPNDSN